MLLLEAYLVKAGRAHLLGYFQAHGRWYVALNSGALGTPEGLAKSLHRAAPRCHRWTSDGGRPRRSGSRAEGPRAGPDGRVLFLFLALQIWVPRTTGAQSLRVTMSKDTNTDVSSKARALGFKQTYFCRLCPPPSHRNGTGPSDEVSLKSHLKKINSNGGKRISNV